MCIFLNVISSASSAGSDRSTLEFPRESIVVSSATRFNPAGSETASVLAYVAFIADPKMAGEIATPIISVKKEAPIATPSNLLGTALWMTIVFTVGIAPKPRPANVAARTLNRIGVSAVKKMTPNMVAVRMA